MITLHHGDCLEVLKNIENNSIDSLVSDPPAGISFMGKNWDHDKGGRDNWIQWMSEIMTECFRVMKPGAHGLIWSIPRTSHWTATALEDAGFEIRDVITHLFGSGFPKSLDISKAIDKNLNVERKIIGRKDVGPDHRGTNYANKITGKRMIADITAATSDLAKHWEGWGTALKPASEHWILIRKPISEKTVAANVLKYGVGGINIDECRISVDENEPNKRNTPSTSVNAMFNNAIMTRGATLTQGRFPANLVLSHSDHCTDEQCDIECAIKMLDEQSGNCRSSGTKSKTDKKYRQGDSSIFHGAASTWYNDKGGASRFFYCAKASAKDKNAGLDKPSTHPTVKSTKLMQYLIKLITPKDGVVLDPFMGSGSTGVACKNLNRKFIGIEKEKEYFDIAEKRIQSVNEIML